MTNIAKFKVFENRIISIPIEFVKVYNESVGPLTNSTAEYLIKTSNCNKNNTDSELRKALIMGIQDEISAYSVTPKLLKEYLEEHDG